MKINSVSINSGLISADNSVMSWRPWRSPYRHGIWRRRNDSKHEPFVSTLPDSPNRRFESKDCRSTVSANYSLKGTGRVTDAKESLAISNGECWQALPLFKGSRMKLELTKNEIEHIQDLLIWQTSRMMNKKSTKLLFKINKQMEKMEEEDEV